MKYRVRSKSLLISCLTIILFISGCWKEPVIRYYRDPSFEASSIKKIAVAPMPNEFEPMKSGGTGWFTDYFNDYFKNGRGLEVLDNKTVRKIYLESILDDEMTPDLESDIQALVNSIPYNFQSVPSYSNLMGDMKKADKILKMMPDEKQKNKIFEALRKMNVDAVWTTEVDSQQVELSDSILEADVKSCRVKFSLVSVAENKTLWSISRDISGDKVYTGNDSSLGRVYYREIYWSELYAEAFDALENRVPFKKL